MSYKTHKIDPEDFTQYFKTLLTENHFGVLLPINDLQIQNPKYYLDVIPILSNVTEYLKKTIEVNEDKIKNKYPPRKDPSVGYQARYIQNIIKLIQYVDNSDNEIKVLLKVLYTKLKKLKLFGRFNKEEIYKEQLNEIFER